MEDSQIIQLYWERNTDAISQTERKYGRYCKTIAHNILQNEEDAEECVNDTLLGAWTSIPPKHPDNLPVYLGKLTRNRAINAWRAQRRDKRGGGTLTLAWEEIAEIMPSGESVEQEMISQETVLAINRFLAALPVTERSVFLRRYWYFDELPVICERFGFRSSKVKSMLYRTRIKLKKYLKKEGFL
ncbi:MAG: sigma-70 family RNA polymerase sigma factor [Oscillospiraceae bacterium]|nr:sigma-70 family RNA polymerase sigma factor [Oscillospiraceae bacterium]